MKKLLVSITALACALVGSAADAESAATGFRKLGAMIDVSRGRVFTVPYLQGCFERMAKMGYNGVMLYTEETYKLEGVPKWGYMRGCYTLDDIKELKGAADANGLELVPCIQTLGHLEKYLRWTDADDVRCSDSTLLVGDARILRALPRQPERDVASVWIRADPEAQRRRARPLRGGEAPRP